MSTLFLIGLLGTVLALGTKTKTSGKKLKDFPGYTIENCKFITVLQNQKALDYAFEKGIIFTGDINKILFGGCSSLDLTDLTTATNYYLLKYYYYLGAYSKGKITKEAIAKKLIVIKGLIKFDTSKWLTENELDSILNHV